MRASSIYSSHYGSAPGTPRSSSPSSLAPSSLYSPVSSPEPGSDEFLPPTPLKAAYTRTQLRPQPPLAELDTQDTAIYRDLEVPSRTHSPFMRTPSPFAAGPSPVSPISGTVSPVSSRMQMAPSPVLSPAFFAARSPTGRPLTPLPENCEIAIPPGAAVPSHFLRPDTPVEQLEFHVSRKGSLSEASNVIQYAPLSRTHSPALGAGMPAQQFAGFANPWERQPQSPAPSTYAAPSTHGDHDWEHMPTPAPALTTLWNAAQGAAPMYGDGGVTVLSMYRQPPPLAPNSPNALTCSEHYTFGPTSSQPFYTLRAQQLSPLPGTMNELTLSRKSPLLGDSIKVMHMQFPAQLPADGLVTMLYPKRAVLSALSRSANPNPKAVILQAADTECCKLIYSEARGRYELDHPAVTTRNGEAVLVVKISGPVGFDNIHAKGTIKLVNTTSQETLVALDFANGGRLLVNTNATAKVESQHIVDVAVGAVLCVAAAEGRKVREASTVGASSVSGKSGTSAGTWAEKEGKKAAKVGGDKAAGTRSGPGRWVVLILNGFRMILWFVPMLGWEIGKAIVLAFRDPDKPKKKKGGDKRRR